MYGYGGMFIVGINRLLWAGLGLAFLGPIFFPILAFGRSKYGD